ncbi:RNA ligase family protein [Actinoplanes sp. DH11]|uniref:RNA ligase family protein n=1 Tax=Actinoplanes sp. DH11 TaxID=2857011 RepID=UPI001E340FBE|nr:RNA ligase family protein [Actinoplanes sp. DH11]
MFDVRAANLAAVNSLTKYPSIPTYHELDPRNGSLTETVTVFAGAVHGTEKVDGTNSRVILLPDGSYLLGSREELLYARGDLIGNPALGIVDNLRPIAEELRATAEELTAAPGGDAIRVFYLELYGGKIGGQAKQYSTRGATGWRLFDVAVIDALDERLGWAPARISAWREERGQRFLGEQELQVTSAKTGIDLTPRLFTLDGADLPATITETHAFLADRLPATLVALDESGLRAPEGIVLRTADRSTIAKARVQDYARTLKRRR